ncbi:D-tagatose-bisphosphate aldolase, class II, non-catalytic subunit [Agrobacterium rubi]|uniref:D-tagatose-bisphosphate aldolase, class II, non-catalytic subunit n=1 Tax=Agrobacterium rubi TaxID=28099 RepID=UPI001573685C|nr:D-tagatose-bisphosphate aldolase, class II, non-catalytic subunit [Agrobacterium rubi]NTF10457.1 D-tagatose-bisphosphate aldolase, class II, non-catalytic subunit [Agrobacterium rubi]NTF22851.1 D-tagatose-bisphosphate aldolase, class II, non-catalytic subunit [Agrobacterium rubi]NTF29782.1 D-tagatose-bisphosphate aldolase, class II, non-catalytic subunit [Agrobacterium rubi]
MSGILQQLAVARVAGNPVGITSVCTAHPIVLRAAIRRAKITGRHVLIEATCNQVNHLGGYTGLTPSDFVGLVLGIANEEGLAHNLIVFGGDHLGPNPWKREPAEVALQKARTMVEAYVAAGFTKIHIDTSMGCAGEPAALDDVTIAHRAADICKTAEAAALKAGVAPPVYILGTEVPVPGGADHVLDSVEPTSAEDARKTIAIHQDIFEKAGLADAFGRVIAFVVQPGVEFGSENVIVYDPPKATELVKVLENHDGLVFEAHSTDYQPEEALTALVRDGFAILKVGPGVTFEFREALYALDMIATEIVPGYGTRPLASVMEELMVNYPDDWKGHYHGDEMALRIQRHYSYSDRIRYYWNRPEALSAVRNLLTALHGRVIPEPLLRQFLPEHTSPSAASAEDILIAAVDAVLAIYNRATTAGRA